MSKEKIRKCIGCSELKNREDMIKITFDTKLKKLILCPDNHTFGHSYYLCKNKNCIDSVFKKNKFSKITRTKPDETLKEEIYKILG